MPTYDGSLDPIVAKGYLMSIKWKLNALGISMEYKQYLRHATYYSIDLWRYVQKSIFQQWSEGRIEDSVWKFEARNILVNDFYMRFRAFAPYDNGEVSIPLESC